MRSYISSKVLLIRLFKCELNMEDINEYNKLDVKSLGGFNYILRFVCYWVNLGVREVVF